jgi:hypothetical protein
MILDKKTSLKLIHRRLDCLAERLKELDKLSEARAQQQKEFEDLRAEESQILAADGADTEQSLQSLLKVRGKCDLKASAVGQSDRKIALAEERVSVAAEQAGQLVYAFKLAAIDAHFRAVEARAAEHFDKQDFGLLRALAGKTEKARSLTGSSEFHFSPQSPTQRTLDIEQARNISGSFAQLEQDASSLDVKIDIPHTWLD